MHKRALEKPDGRRLLLYSRRPLDGRYEAPSPNREPVGANPHLRWHPLRGEWVAYAAHRQNRTFMPPPEYNPLAPTRSTEFPTELPEGDYDVAVFENLFPSLAEHATAEPSLHVATAPARGTCEVVVFTQDAKGSLGGLPTEHVRLLIDVWADRYEEIGSRSEIAYVMPFENRGVEVGVTLSHPHGQIYSYPFVPTVPKKILENQKSHYAEHGRGLLEEFIAAELEDQTRILYDGPHTVAFVPVCARYTYEVWIAPKRRSPSLSALSPEERTDFARALRTVLLKYDGLWNKTFPYLMVFHQAPTDGQDHSYAHFYLEFSPPLRTESRLKYLAGTELGAGMFANDSIPEEKAAELRSVSVEVE